MAVEDTAVHPAREAAVDVDVVNLGCGEDYREGELNVDAVPDCHPDVVVDLGSTPWPFPNDSFTYVRAYHVFEHLDEPVAALEESARILKPGGTLEARVPIGLDARADPDHKTEWTWRAPEFYVGGRHWHDDVALSIASRNVELWSHLPGPFGDWYERVVDRWLNLYGPGPWCFSLAGVSGEFTILFEQRRSR